MSKKRDLIDGDYPFGTGHWQAWSNKKRFDWLSNFRDKLKKNDNALARKFDIPETDLAQMDKDVETLRATVLAEKVKLN
jgi:hypothetical protein